MQSILEEAQKLIHGDRAESYGPAREHLEKVAKLWSEYLKLIPTGPLNCSDVCWLMVLLKMARQAHSSKRDNLIDAAGYIGLIDKAENE